MANEWDLQNLGEIIYGLVDFNGYHGGRLDGFEGMEWAKKVLRKEDC